MSEEAEPQQVFEELKRGNHRFWIGTVFGGGDCSYWRLTDYAIMKSYYPCSLYRQLHFLKPMRVKTFVFLEHEAKPVIFACASALC
jgi:hypothetical protein